MSSLTLSQIPVSHSQHKMNTHLLLPSSSSSSSIVVPCVFSQKGLFCSSNLQLKVKPSSLSKISVKCSSSSTPPVGPGSGETESKSVLDAFFLGKALAEAINERIESTVGEILSEVGRFQAEQQKQVQDFQEDVLERARRAKEKATREAMEAESLVSKPTIEVSTTYVPSTGKVSLAKDPLLGMFVDD